MIGTFPGQLSLGDERVDVDLEMSGEAVRLATPASEIGTWPLDTFRVSPNGDGTFQLTIDGDDVAFAPLQPGAFESAITSFITLSAAAGSHLASPLMQPEIEEEPAEPGPSEEMESTLIPQAPVVSEPEQEEDLRDTHEELLEVERKLRSTSKFSLASGALKKLLLVVGFLALVGIVVFTAPAVTAVITGISDADSAAETTVVEPVTATTVTSVPPSTQAPTTVSTEALGVEPTVLGIPTEQFTARWNEVGGSVVSALKLPTGLLPGEFEYSFNSYLLISGTVNDQQAVESYSVTVDPSGPPASDQLGIQTLGVAISVAAPGLEGPELADLLAILGLDVADPQLGGLDGEYERDGVSYELVFDDAAELLMLSISFIPES